ncbi:MAG TPA: hypothetical protein VFK40_11260 [Nitrososphaeraceae archaeon]|nr:hypothetical protein [Nitrososphaeraceae archaeon]
MPNLDPWMDKQLGNNNNQNTQQLNETKQNFEIIYYHIELKIKIR